MERGEDAFSLSRKSTRSERRKSSYCSSVSSSSSVVKRKEKLALAQLKKKQLLREQELQRQMTELQYEREFMEAQVEEERATVSLEVYEQPEEGNKIDSVERSKRNMDPVLKELELSATRETESYDLNKEPTRSDEKSNAACSLSMPTCTSTCTFGTITCPGRHL